ncbi:MAG: methylmalonyl-CoA epimerase [Ignavibacteriae bacterium]|nr:methylmalonyl-CoA epimerase [Ignavibacteriota bacterium]
MKLAHIGIAVKSLDESVSNYEKIFGVEASELEHVAEQKVNVRKLHLDNMDIELLEGTAPDSPISKFIEKRGEGVHHCSFEVDDIVKSLSDAKNSGIELINETPRTGADDMLIAFLHPKSTGGVLIEYTQKKH